MDFTQKKFRNLQSGLFDHSPKEGEEVKWRPSAYGIIRNDEGKILLIVDGRSQKWEFPGGGVDLGETPQEGVVREVLEETGYECKLLKEVPVYFSTDYFYSLRENAFYQALLFFFRGEVISEQKEQNLDFEDEITEVGWFTLEEIKELNVAAFHKEAFERLKEFI